MDRQHAIRLGPTEREKYGVIATLEDGDGRRFAEQFVGRNATAVVVVLCRAKGWRIVSLSTPETIYRDLQGTREPLNRDERGSRAKGYASLPDRVNRPEVAMLAKLKAGDLLV